MAGLQRYMSGPVEWFFAAGHFGVPIFFVISGFVITHSIGKSRITPRYFGNFILRRSIRLDPPYWASIVITVLLLYLSRRVVVGKEIWLPGWGDYLAHVFYLQGILGRPQINVIYWTLCIEVQFYLVFCILTGISQLYRRNESDDRLLTWFFVVAAAVSLLWPFGIAPAGLNPGLFLPFWHGFLLGAFAYWSVIGRLRWWMFYSYVSFLVLAVWLHCDSFTTVCIIVSVILAEVGRAKRLQTWLNWKWLQFLGMISYSLYLIHNPITGAAYNVGFRLTGRTPATELIWFALVLATNIACAFILWYLVERPSVKFSNRFKSRKVNENEESQGTSSNR